MDPAPIDEPPVESLSPFWGVLEIAGAIAVIVPFVITMSSSSLQTENGHVVKFVFRDWIAVGGGAVAILCGLGAAARFKTTEQAKRGLRLAVVLVLLGLGAFQILRGFGVTASSPEMASSSSSGPTEDPMMREMLDRQRAKQAAEAAKAPVAEAPPVDLAAPLAATLALMEAGDVKALYASVTPGFQKAVSLDGLTELLARINAAIGACGPVTPPVSYVLKDGYWNASAQVKCDKDLIVFSAEFVIDKGIATVNGFNVKNAKESQPAVADAEALARRLADDLLKAAMDRLADDFDPRLKANLGDLKAFGEKLQRVAANAGKVGELKQTTSTAKSESEHDFAYDIAAAKHHLTFTATTEFFMTRWFVTSFNIEPVEAAPPKQP